MSLAPDSDGWVREREEGKKKRREKIIEEDKGGGLQYYVRRGPCRYK